MSATNGDGRDTAPGADVEAEAPRLTETVEELADEWFRVAQRCWYPTVGRRTLFYAIPQNYRFDYAKWVQIFTEIISMVGPEATVSDITPRVLLQWVSEKCHHNIYVSEIELDIWWLGRILSFAVEQGFTTDNAIRNCPPLIPREYVGGRGTGATQGLINRRDNPVHQALVIRREMEASRLSARGVATRLGMTQSKVSKTLALLKLQTEIMRAVERGDIPASTALTIAKHPDPSAQLELAKSVIGGGVRRDKVTAIVKQAIRHAREAEGPDRSKCPLTLGGAGEPVIVMGVERPPLPGKPRLALKALADEWPSRISLGRLEARAGTTARHHLRKLIEMDRAPWWRAIIRFPGGAWKGYGLVWPSEADHGVS